MRRKPCHTCVEWLVNHLRLSTLESHTYYQGEPETEGALKREEVLLDILEDKMQPGDVLEWEKREAAKAVAPLRA